MWVLTPTDLAVVFVVLLLAAIVRGIIGFGLPLLSMPFLILVLPPKTVLAAFVLALLVTNLQILVHDGVPWGFLWAEWPLVLTTLVGTVVGVAALSASSPQIIFLVISGYVIFYIVLDRYEEAIHGYANLRGTGSIVGLSSGILGGLVSLQGVILITYLHAKQMEKRTFVTTAASILFIGVAMRIPPMISTGLLGFEEALLGVGFLAPTMIGTYIGARCRPYIPRDVFEAVIKGLLVLIAIKLAIDGLGIDVGTILP
jgi:uncharacterized membrane protein YfcA